MNLPANTTDYTLDITMFDSKSYIVTPEKGLPYNFLQVTPSSNSLHFRPIPPSDF